MSQQQTIEPKPLPPSRPDPLPLRRRTITRSFGGDVMNQTAEPDDERPWQTQGVAAGAAMCRG